MRNTYSLRIWQHALPPIDRAVPFWPLKGCTQADRPPADRLPLLRIAKLKDKNTRSLFSFLSTESNNIIERGEGFRKHFYTTYILICYFFLNREAKRLRNKGINIRSLWELALKITSDDYRNCAGTITRIEKHRMDSSQMANWIDRTVWSLSHHTKSSEEIWHLLYQRQIHSNPGRNRKGKSSRVTREG